MILVLVSRIAQGKNAAVIGNAEVLVTIKDKAHQVAMNGDSFIFITDMHLDHNFRQSPKLIKYILDNTLIKSVVFGGDTYTSANDTDEAFGYFMQFNEDFRSVENCYAARGNHDIMNSLTDNDFYYAFNKSLEDKLGTLNKEVYFYKDNVSQKIRYIFCDGSSIDSTIPTAQANWITQRITELDSSWSVILFTHSYWEGTNIGQSLTVNTVGASIKSIIDNAVDNANATVVALITGHTHRDKYIVADKGYAIIATTCDANGTLASTYDDVTPNRIQGTTSEQVFDVFNIDTLNKKIYITRIGGNGQDREITYQ